MGDRPYNTDNPVVEIASTLGKIAVELFPKEAPDTVANFLKLVEKGYYDGVIFHRVIPKFMVQTGDPTGTGRGGPGWTILDEFHPKLKHGKGSLSMAHAGTCEHDPSGERLSGACSNGSQFFITHVATPWLDDKHSVFGRVVEGQDVLMAISPRDPNTRGAPAVHIQSIEILEG